MTDARSDFQKAIEAVCSGSEEAVWNFIEVYGPHIQRVVRRRLHQRLRSKFDSIDFVQMVWASFFADPQRIAQMRDPEELLRYLVAMARNKVIDETRRRMAYEKYDVRREQSLDSADRDSPSARAPDTPSQVAMARERWLQLMDAQSDRDRQIVELRMKGATFHEIAQTLGIHERTARHVIKSLVEAG